MKEVIIFILKIRYYRILRNLNQNELAKLAGVHQSHISALEKPNRTKSPTLNTLENIARALKICPLDLIQCDCFKCKGEN